MKHGGREHTVGLGEEKPMARRRDPERGKGVNSAATEKCRLLGP